MWHDMTVTYKGTSTVNKWALYWRCIMNYKHVETVRCEHQMTSYKIAWKWVNWSPSPNKCNVETKMLLFRIAVIFKKCILLLLKRSVHCHVFICHLFVLYKIVDGQYSQFYDILCRYRIEDKILMCFNPFFLCFLDWIRWWLSA